MTTLNFCEHNGHLISADEDMPEDPSVYAAPDLPRIEGCNHLICTACDKPVRDGAHFFPDKSKGRAKEIYETADWHQLPYMVYKDSQVGDVRLYCCQCAIAWTRLPKPLDDPGEKGIPYSWRCGGHPPIALPYRFFGFEVTARTDWRELVVRGFTGWHPPDLTLNPADKEPGSWLWTLYERLHQLPEGRMLSEAVSGGLSHEDARVRSLALRFFGTFHHAPGALRVRALAAGDRALYRDIADPYPILEASPQLEDSLIWALSKQLGEGRDNTAVLAALKAEALRPGRAFATLSQLGEYDPAWLAEHALEIARATPSCAPELIRGIYLYGTRLPEVGPGILDVPGVDLGQIQKLVEEHVHGKHKRAMVAALRERKKPASRGKP